MKKIRWLFDKKSRILGYLDAVNGVEAEGWVMDQISPDRQLELEIRVDGALVGHCKANRARKDLKMKGIGTGNYAFVFRFPQPLSSGEHHVTAMEVTARKVLTGSGSKHIGTSKAIVPLVLEECTTTIRKGNKKVFENWKKLLCRPNKKMQQILTSSNIFNPAWYREKYPDVCSEKVDPLRHFLNFGIKENRSPCMLFDPEWYCKSCGPMNGLGAFEHYIMIGSKKNFDPHPVFSSAYYKKQLPDVDWSDIDPLSHYYIHYENQDVNPHFLFNTQYYIKQLHGKITIGISPLEHYLAFGWLENLDPSILFSTYHYLRKNPKLQEYLVCPLSHYLKATQFTDLDPHPLFMSQWYEETHACSQHHVNPLVHFVTQGFRENLMPHPLFDSNWYADIYMTHRESNKRCVQTGNVHDVIQHDDLSLPLMHYLNENKSVFSVAVGDYAKETLLEDARRRIAALDNIHAVIVYNFDCISGGIISIFSLVKELRTLGKNAQIYALPEGNNVVRYSQFQNNETILTFNDFARHCSENKIAMTNVPEVMVDSFLQHILEKKIDISKIALNILNQNETLMPGVDSLKKLASFAQSVTMTTAHLEYSTQRHADKWGLPLKHLSTYMSYDDYTIVPFDKKLPLFLWSPDRRPSDDSLFVMLNESMPAYRFFRILSLHYEFYKLAIASAKYTLTLGEGLDNYFIEACFTGGFGFTVYNSYFMPEEFQTLDNVFDSLIHMKASLPCVIRDIETDPEYRAQLFEANYSILKAIYDKRIYLNKVSEFLDDKFDYTPSTRFHS